MELKVYNIGLEKVRLFFGALIIVILCFSYNSTAQPKDTLRVLFVGNSYTYIWNIPRMVSVIAASQNKVIIARQSTVGGAYFEEHWKGERGLKTVEKISNGKWDFVILQNNSLSAIQSYDKFLEYGKKLINLIKENNSVPLLYLTWAREYNPLMQNQINKAYQDLASQTGAKVVPVGMIWNRVHSLRPDLRLYEPDGSHPSTIGSYLIANIFYAYLTHNKASKVSGRVVDTDKYGESLFLNIVPQNDADFMHEAIDEYLFSK